MDMYVLHSCHCQRKRAFDEFVVSWTRTMPDCVLLQSSFYCVSRTLNYVYGGALDRD